jgi:hypothetical protein
MNKPIFTGTKNFNGKYSNRWATARKKFQPKFLNNQLPD